MIKSVCFTFASLWILCSAQIASSQGTYVTMGGLSHRAAKRNYNRGRIAARRDLARGKLRIESPANSYGFMDGGIDALYLDHFGTDIQARLRRHILDHHHGELVVGHADVIETGHGKIPFLIAAPTMRVPMNLGETVNPYLAARAVFVLVTHGRFASGTFAGEPVSSRIQTIAMPGLGTGVGKVGPNTCAHQVRAAIDDILLGQYRMPQSWAEASERHQLLYTTKPKRLQY